MGGFPGLNGTLFHEDLKHASENSLQAGGGLLLFILLMAAHIRCLMLDESC